MSSLAASIKELGVLQPVLVRQIGADAADEFELIAGERRWRAARRAGLQTIPVLIQTSDDTTASSRLWWRTSIVRISTSLEEAAAYQQLIEEFGYTHDQVATRVGKSRTAVTNTLRLLQLPSGVQRLLAEGQISPGHARALLGTPDRGYQEVLAKSIVDRGADRAGRRGAWSACTCRAGHRRRRGAAPTPSPSEADGVNASRAAAGRAVPGRLPPPGILELEELLSSHLNTRVKVDMSQSGGKWSSSSPPSRTSSASTS